jgi:hypothetical protein
MNKLTLENPDEQVEFQIATHQALVNMEPEFLFQGFIVLTAHAVDAVNDIVAGRTYH